MMCHRMGRPPISTIGLGRNSVSSLRRVPNPPQRITTFIVRALAALESFGLWDRVPEHGRNTVIPHAPAEERVTEVLGRPGARLGYDKISPVSGVLEGY